MNNCKLLGSYQCEPTKYARYYDYATSANPIGQGVISKIPFHSFYPVNYNDGVTRVTPLDLSFNLGCDFPATTPGLLANFINIREGENISINPNSTSSVFYIQKGNGKATQGDISFNYFEGDFFALPGNNEIFLCGHNDNTIFNVNDSPLLNYLGVKSNMPQFPPTHYLAKEVLGALDMVRSDEKQDRNRVSILLGNVHLPQTRTITQTLWTMFGIVEPHSVQKPHRHQSVAIDYIPKASCDSYTLIGTELDEYGDIINPTRVDWTSGMVFITPPGYWHAHYNNDNEPSYVIPIQDAGLHTWLRSLDIRFS
ncbi:TPA: hypothetical protein ACXZLZ_004219 [Salmonella enterica]